MSHGVIIAVLGFIMFIGAGVVMSTQVDCGLKAIADDESLNETQKRSDDQSFFTHMLCTAMKAKHNR